VGVQRLEREADHSSPSSTEIRDRWSFTSIPSYVFMTWCLNTRKILRLVRSFILLKYVVNTDLFPYRTRMIEIQIVSS